MAQKHLTEIERAAENAIQIIANAADKAAQTISSAALSATKLLVSNASDAAKIVNEKKQDDHDLIIEIKTIQQTMLGEIREIKDGTAQRIATLEQEKLNTKDSYPVMYKAGVDKMLDDHENRIRINTTKITIIWTVGLVLIFIVPIIEFLISNFLIK